MAVSLEAAERAADGVVGEAERDRDVALAAVVDMAVYAHEEFVKGGSFPGATFRDHLEQHGAGVPPVGQGVPDEHDRYRDALGVATSGMAIVNEALALRQEDS